MKYYSEKLKKLFDNVKELEAAEKEFDKIQAEKGKELEAKKLRAKEVENAYMNYQQTIKDTNKFVAEANEKYLKLRNEFVKDYGSFHMSYTKENLIPSESNINEWNVLDSISGWLYETYFK